MKRRFILHAVALAVPVLLAACGGGDDGGEDTPSVTNYWTMDTYRYLSGGNSATATTTIGDRPRTVAVISTATTSGGDQANGKFSGSALTFSFNGTGAGVYTVVPSKAALSADGVVANAVVVEVNVGIAVTTGSTLYTASSGTVRVTVGDGGVLHFDAQAVPMARTLDVLGGVEGAPATMTLEVHDAH
nr:hypothetical protein [Variovorax boronicumulans]